MAFAALLLLPLVAVAGAAAVGGSPRGGEWAFAVLAGALVVTLLAVRVTSQVGGYVQELERSRSEFRRALHRLGDALEASGDRQALVEVVLETSRAMVGAEAAVFYVDAGNHLLARAERGAPSVLEARVQPGEGLVGWVMQSREPARWPPTGSPPGEAEPAAASAMAVPIHARGRLYGVLALYAMRDRPFGREELDDVRDFVRQGEAAIDRTFLHDETRRLSVTDGLTGVWNRRHLDLRCSQELERASRFGERFAVVMCDIDDFKEVNDTYGHQTGDAVLVELARRLIDSVREVDLVARYGGEEFVLLLPQTDLDGAVRVAEKVRLAVDGRPFETDAGSLVITVSLGVAFHPDHGASVGSLLGAADAALYRAKDAGKNRVCHAPGADEQPE